MKIFFIFSFIFILISCGLEGGETANSGFAKTLSEDEVINKIMHDFISDPKDQKELDLNIIINHIIDQKLDMQSTDSGIYYQIIREGKGQSPKKNDWVAVRYKGSFLNGKIFDKSKGAEPHSFFLGKVIDGWKEAFPMLKTGGKGLFIIPSRLCYGEEGFGDLIPANTILQFEIELLGIQDK